MAAALLRRAKLFTKRVPPLPAFLQRVLSWAVLSVICIYSTLSAGNFSPLEEHPPSPLHSLYESRWLRWRCSFNGHLPHRHCTVCKRVSGHGSCHGTPSGANFDVAHLWLGGGEWPQRGEACHGGALPHLTPVATGLSVPQSFEFHEGELRS